MAVKFSNNFSTALASSISSSDTVIELLSVSGLPTLGAGDYTYLTFDTDTNSPTIEIVKVTAINAGTNEVTVTRAQDGTTASSFAAGTKVELRLSAILLNDVSDEASVTDWGDILNKPSLLLTNGDGSDLTDVRAETVEVTVKNVSGGSLAKGTPVHQTGTSGAATFEVVAADASNASVMPAHFVLLETLADQAEGRGLLMGRISGVDTSSFSEGDTIYVAVGGGYTNVAPAGEGNLIQNLGTVTKVHASNGGGEVMGAGRSNATPNLNNGNIFIGNASNQATTASLSTSVSNLSHYNNANWDTAYSWGNHASQGYATTTYVDTAVSNLVDAAPTTLDTLNELAAALGDDPNFATTVSNQIGLKQDASTALTTSTTFGGDVSGTYNAIVIADDSHTHDGRYYTESEADSRFVNAAGDTMTGELTFYTDNEGITFHGGGRFYKQLGQGLVIRKPNGGQELRFEDNSGNYLGTFWHSGNDGASSGLDADLLDGQHGSYYYSAGNPPPYPSDADTVDGLHAASFLRSDANDTATGVITFSNVSDYQIILDGAGGYWSGIRWQDSGGYDHIWYRGATSTFAIGGGGSTVSGKKLHVHGGLSVGTSVAGTSTPANGIYSEGALTVPLIYGSAGNTALELNHVAYTMLSDPEGARRLYLGDSGDPGNYYDNTTHYFRDRASSVLSTISSSGLNLQVGGYQVNGTTRINSVGDGLFTSLYIGSTNIVDTNRNLTNIGTISSGSITSSGSGQFAGYLRVTQSGGAQTFLIGNQDSAGVNKPAMIMGVNGYLRLGHGDSWSGGGGTFTEVVSLSGNNLNITSGWLQMGGTNLIDPSRNLTNVGTATFNGAVTMNSSLNVASTIGIAGVTVIDASRNILGIGNITSSGKASIGDNNRYISAMQTGALEIGSIVRDFRYTSGWSGAMQAGVLANCLDAWEFVIHDSGDALGSAFAYQGNSANGVGYFEMGRDLGWGAADYVFRRNVGIGVTSPTKPLHIYTGANEGIFLQGTGSGVWMDVQSGTSELWSMGADNNGWSIYNRTDSTYYFRVGNSGTVDVLAGDLNVAGNTTITSATDGKLILKDTTAGTVPWNYINFHNSSNQRNAYVGTNAGNEFHIVGETGMSLLYTNLNFTAAGAISAPIYYDSNDTSYYTDPNGTSRINTLVTTGGNSYFNNNRIVLRADGIEDHQTAGDGGNIQINYYGYGNGHSYFRNFDVYNGKGNFQLQVHGSGNYTRIWGSLQTTSITDTDDSSFYLNPNGTSRLNLISPYVRFSPGSVHGNSLEANEVHLMDAGSASVLADGLQFNAATFTVPVMYARSGSTWTNIGNQPQLCDGKAAHDFGRVTLSRSYDEFVFYFGTQFGYTIFSAVTILHSTSGNSMTIYVESSETGGATDSGWTQIATSGDTGSWPGSTTLTCQTGVGAGYNDQFRIRIVPNWSHASNTISIGQIIVRAGYGSVRRLFDWDYNKNVEFYNNTTSTTSFRAPIFYDSNDTSYYVDPNGASNTLNTNHYGVVRLNSTGAYMVGAPTYGFRFNNDADTINSLIVDNSGNSIAYLSHRAPIFYDSNNTSFFTDPSATSQIRKTNLFALGSAWDDGLNLYSSDLTNRWNLLVDNGAGDIFRLAFNNSEAFGVGTNGEAYFTAGLRANIYYDRNDTGYYVDPNVASVLSGPVTINGNDNQLRINGTYGPKAAGIFFQQDGVNKYELYYYSGQFRFWNYARAAQEMNISDSGVVTVHNDFRAPIMYDVNDTSRRVDPNGTSELANVNVNNVLEARSGSKIIVQNSTDGGTSRGLFLWNSSDANWGIYMSTPGAGKTIAGTTAPAGLGGVIASHAARFRVAANSANGFIWENSSNATLMSLQGDAGNLYTSHSVRSPIFYDSNDTSFYLDPNSNSLLRTVYTQNGSYHFRPRYTDGSDIYSGSFNWYGLQLGNNGTNYIVAGRTVAGGALDIYVNNTSDFPSINGTHSSRFESNGIFYNYHSVRSPLFYDYNDTNYYVDPASSSVLQAVTMYGRTRIGGEIYISAFNSNTLNSGFTHGGNGSDIWINYRGYNDGQDYTRDFRVGNGRGSQVMWVSGSGSYVEATNDFRAPIFYDSNNTGYYVDPAGATSAKFAQFVQIGDSSSYGTNSGSWGARLNVTDNVHAKIEVGQDANGMLSHWYAHTGQSSIKFGTSSSHDVEFQRGGATQLYLNSGYAGANNQFRAPIFYDSGNTGYYVDPASTSVLSTLTTYGQIYINNASPTIYLQDTDNRSSMIHCNSNVFYVLRGSGTNSSGWATYNGYWPMELSLETNDATFGNAITAVGNITAYSDARKKKDIRPLEGGLEYLSALDAKRYKWRVDDREDIGFIAQDVEAAGLDVFVIESERKDPDTGEHIESVKSLDYGRMVSVLWQAVKEQQTQIEAMAAEIKSLKEMKQ